ncbi:MAG: 2-vinyl bacteriochlorophyllide hydratase [Betaproteobacteria bacterium]|jgi:3-vinyl bacteriochlorophyllide hydratase|nr:2-vinyl bacteriochlorophyllide hydratase [Betaproteobacteria bacterium]
MIESTAPTISVGLYTPEERARRDATIWTPVQGFLAAFQFIVFAVSVCLITRFMVTGLGETAAIWSVVFKTLVLYAIMVTGSIWEKVVFDKWLFAHSFFWEDVFSFLVLGLHTAYLWSLYTGNMNTYQQLWLALAAYAAYAINAGQFLLKLRAARVQERATLAMHQELTA